jgi:hypothetical protein
MVPLLSAAIDRTASATVVIPALSSFSAQNGDRRGGLDLGPEQGAGDDDFAHRRRRFRRRGGGRVGRRARERQGQSGRDQRGRTDERRSQAAVRFDFHA